MPLRVPTRITLSGIFLSLGIYRWFKFLNKVNKKFLFLELLKEMPEFTVEQMKERVLKSGKAIQGLVRGVLDSPPEEYVESTIVKSMKLLYLRLTNRKFQYQDARQMYETEIFKRMSSLMTIEGITKDKIYIYDIMNTSFEAATEIIYNSKKDVESHLTSTLFTSIVNILGILTNSETLKNLSDAYYSSLYEERFIVPRNSKIVYGTFEQVGQSVVTKGHKYIARNRYALISMLESRARLLNVMKYLSGILIFFLTAWFVYRLSVRLFAQIKKHQSDILETLKTIVVDKLACKQCSKNMRSIIFQQCRHLAVCKDCMKKIDRCPVCGKEFRDPIELYCS